MRRSTHRILTTHAGSLPRPDPLIEANRDRPMDPATAALLRAAVADVVKQQAAAGIDVVNDGEFGKPMTSEVDYGAWATYAFGRLSGFERRELLDMPAVMKEIMGDSRDRRDFARFYAAANAVRGPIAFPVNVGPIRYAGHALVQRDIANFKAALGSIDAADAFLSSVFTGVQVGKSEHYASKDEQAVAVAEAMREEYAAIVNAGLNVQIDDPILVNVYEFRYSVERDFAGFRKWAQSHVELVNHSLAGLPEERVRYHLCWGSWLGPHSADLPLAEVVDLLLQINASQYSFEAANPQHEHEWKVWQDVRLPAGKALIPGVVTHKTTILEHPEVVADRIVRYADAVGRENVIAGTDCGFGGRIDPEIAWAKLRALAEGAALANDRLW